MHLSMKIPIMISYLPIARVSYYTEGCFLLTITMPIFLSAKVRRGRSHGKIHCDGDAPLQYEKQRDLQKEKGTNMNIGRMYERLRSRDLSR